MQYHRPRLCAWLYGSTHHLNFIICPLLQVFRKWEKLLKLLLISHLLTDLKPYFWHWMDMIAYIPTCTCTNAFPEFFFSEIEKLLRYWALPATCKQHRFKYWSKNIIAIGAGLLFGSCCVCYKTLYIMSIFFYQYRYKNARHRMLYDFTCPTYFINSYKMLAIAHRLYLPIQYNSVRDYRSIYNGT